MPDVLTLAAKYADMQRKAAQHADGAALRRHIADTLRRCLPGCIVTASLVEDCQNSLRGRSSSGDPMYTGAIHAFAGQYLLTATSTDAPLLQRFHQSALRLLPQPRAASRDDLRLVTLDALYSPGILPAGMHTAYLRHRLGLGTARLSNEEIALRMHKPLVYIHELEAALLTILSCHSDGGHHA